MILFVFLSFWGLCEMPPWADHQFAKSPVELQEIYAENVGERRLDSSFDCPVCGESGYDAAFGCSACGYAGNALGTNAPIGQGLGVLLFLLTHYFIISYLLRLIKKQPDK